MLHTGSAESEREPGIRSIGIWSAEQRVLSSYVNSPYLSRPVLGVGCSSSSPSCTRLLYSAEGSPGSAAGRGDAEDPAMTASCFFTNGTRIIHAPTLTRRRVTGEKRPPPST